MTALAAVTPTGTEGCDHIGLMHLLDTVSHIGPTLVSDTESPSALGSGLNLGPMAPQLSKGPPAVAAIPVARPQRVAPPEGK